MYTLAELRREGWPKPGMRGMSVTAAGLARWRGSDGGATPAMAGWRCSGDGGDGRAVAVGYGVGKKSEVNKAGPSYVNRLCRVPAIWHSAKLFFNIKIHFGECPRSDTRQILF
jgi:hypothetical protein